jgi:signal transduction histidine kinase
MRKGSLARRLLLLSLLQGALLVLVALVIWWFTAPHHRHGRHHHPDDQAHMSEPPPRAPHDHDGPPRDHDGSLPFGPLLTLGCAAAILAVGGVLTARWIVRPIEQLTRSARELGEGKLDTRARVERGDEIGELGRRFDDMAERIEKLVRSEKELFANVAHELRTPLARIGVALDLASEGNSERARASLTEIAVDVAELERLVDDILTALRFEVASDASMPLRRQHVAPHEIANAAAERMRARNPERPLEVAIDDGLPEIDVDPVLFRRVVDNLLENAHKYTPDRAAAIRLAVTRDDDRVVFEIADRGVGLSPEELPHVFDAFWRSERSRSRATGGVGLGLTLAKRIIDAHGAGISVTSDVGRGTTARISVQRAAT